MSCRLRKADLANAWTTSGCLKAAVAIWTTSVQAYHAPGYSTTGAFPTCNPVHVLAVGIVLHWPCPTRGFTSPWELFPLAAQPVFLVCFALPQWHRAFAAATLADWIPLSHLEKLYHGSRHESWCFRKICLSRARELVLQRAWANSLKSPCSRSHLFPCG